MARRIQSVASLAISLDRGSSHSLHRQIYRQLREIILAGRVLAGARPPSTRALTKELGVSRTTLELAFDQLRADGHIQGRIGSGTYAAGLPFMPLPFSKVSTLYIRNPGAAIAAEARIGK